MELETYPFQTHPMTNKLLIGFSELSSHAINSPTKDIYKDVKSRIKPHLFVVIHYHWNSNDHYRGSHY